MLKYIAIVSLGIFLIEGDAWASNFNYDRYIKIGTLNASDSIKLKKELKPLLEEGKKHQDNRRLALYYGLLGKGVCYGDDRLKASSLAYFSLATNFAKQSENKAIILWVEIQKAIAYYSFWNVAEAMPCFMKALYLVDEVPKEKKINPLETYKYIGYFFNTLGDYDISNRFLYKALTYVENSNPETVNFIYNIGLNYLNKGDTVTTFKYFKTLENSISLYQDSSQLAKVYGGYAAIDLARGNYKEALKFIDSDINLSKKYDDKFNLLYARILKCKILLKLNQFLPIDTELAEIYKLSKMRSYIWEGYAAEIEGIKLELAIRKGNVTEELIARRALAKWQDSVEVGESKKVLQKVRWQLIREKYIKDADAAFFKAEREKFHKQLYVVIILLLSLAGAFIFLYFRKKVNERNSLYARKVLEFQLEKSQIDKELVDTKESVERYLTFLAQKNKQIERLKNTINAFRGSKLNDIEVKNGQLKELLKSHLMTEENWLVFRKVFDHKYPNYYLNLKRRFLDLTENNLRFIILQKLGLSSIEIANVLGISNDSIKKIKHRLKKRLGEQYAELEGFIRE